MIWTRRWRWGRASGAATLVILLSIVVQGLVMPYGANASTPAGGDLSARSGVVSGGRTTTDLDLSDLCETDRAGIPGLGSAPSASIPCPGGVVTGRPGDLCLLPGLADMCPGIKPPGVGSLPLPGTRSAADEDTMAAPQDAPSPDLGAWTTVESPNASAEPNTLTAVTCLTPSDCWAVGRSSSGLGLTLTMRWDGSSWAAIPSPSVLDARANILSDVTCVATSDCWAVGAYITQNLQVRTLILRWDGTAWTIVNSPDDGPTPWNGFNSVACVSTSECWAVGFTTNSTAKTLIVRWDGSSWEVQDSPNASTQGNVLHGVTCLSTSDCWAVGSYSTDAVTKHTLTLHWNGSSWEVLGAADVPAAQESVLSGVTCVSASDCWAVGHSFNGGARQTLIERWDGTAWTIVSSPNAVGPLDTYLTRVTCASATDCWAVGYSNDTVTIDQHFIVRWNGVLWAPATLPDPVGTAASVLAGIACLSPSDCWAVGSTTSGTDRSLLAHWDGTLWGTVPSPRVILPAESHGYLQDVACVSPADCWAVGFYFSGPVARSITMHWDGLSWAIVDSPNVGLDKNNYLGSVACTSTSSCWAVGRYTTTSDTERQPLILQWDGVSWSIDSTSLVDTGAAQSNALESVSCVSASECVAVGHSNVDGSRYQALAMRWDGVAWTPVPVPLRGDAETFYVPSDLLYDVSCSATSDCWAAGAHWTGTVYQTLVEHWDGVAWMAVTSPNTAPDGGNILSGVACVSPSDCWAVGSSDEYERALIEHWDGTAWSIVASPQTGNILGAVTCLSASDCWAAGAYYTPHPPAKTLLVRWDGTSWTRAVSPNPSATKSNNLAGIACASSSDCWAVGQYFPGKRAQTLTLHYEAPESDPREISEVAFTGDSATTGQHSDEAYFEARLTDSNGDPLAGGSLTFALTGAGSTRQFTAATDGDGIASVTPELSERPASYQLTVSFAGDDHNQGSADAAGFVVTKEDTAVDLQVLEKKTLRARLTDLDSSTPGISGRIIEFFSDGELIGSVETDADGVATVAIPPGYRGSSRTYEAAFAGDDFFLSSSDRTTKGVDNGEQRTWTARIE